jgi:hypothetical protein
MKQLVFVLAALLSVAMHAQVPQGIPYQAVIRDTQGNPIINQSVSVKFSLHDQAADGTIVYEETHSTATNEVGLFSLTFGAGVPSIGAFTSINWSSGYKFLQVQTDIGNGFVDYGTQQLMAVPYALYSGTAGSTQESNPDRIRLGKGFTSVSQNSPSSLSGFAALEYCASLVEGGFSDWRFPTYDEAMDYLFSLEYPLNREYFFWTTTPSTNTSNAWYFVRKSDGNETFVIEERSFNTTGFFKCTCVR